MFKFGFAKDSNDNDEDNNEKKEKLKWIAASKVRITPEQIDATYGSDYYAEIKIFSKYNLKLIRSDKAIEDLTKQNCENILTAESQHSDLIPAKYEGGLKIWECTFDLGQYMLEAEIDLKEKFVMDLGCGAGLIGLISLLSGSTVHFQDYNVEVLRSVTIPNVLLNFNERASALTRCEFYAGDWESLIMLLAKEDGNESRKYDYIFTSETIYNSDNYMKLYEVFKSRLKIDGVGLIAGKTYYFGVGGGMRQFENLVLKDGCFDVATVWKSQDGLHREILKLTRKMLQEHDSSAVRHYRDPLKNN